MRNVEVIPLDLASPGSIDRSAGEFLTTNRALDMLIHNAGLSGPPLTRDERGYDLRLATMWLEWTSTIPISITDPTTSGWLTGSRKPRHRCLRLRLIKGPQRETDARTIQV